MIAMTLSEIAETVAGVVVNDFGGMVTGPAFVDSRRPERGGLFVAVVGERVDGHDYVDQALEGGAVAVLSSRDTGKPGVVVDDPVVALGRLARHVLAGLTGVQVVALTGSQGKTGTKDLLAQVLAAHHGADTVVATRGSFNNEIGLPLTVLRADSGTLFLVLEMGARHVGDLTASCEVAPPDVSVVLNVGKAHLGEFGSREAIAVAKGEVVEALAEGGVAVLNADDPLVAAMTARTAARTVSFGTAEDADVRFEDVQVDELGRPTFELLAGVRGARQRTRVSLGLVGEHHVPNATAAAAAALSLGMPLDETGSALRAATVVSPGRMAVRERADGLVVVDDAYNANPDSMRAALKALAAIGRGRPGGRTVAVLGEMLELGETSLVEHDAVGRLVVRLDIHQLVVVGQGARPIHLGASLEGSWGGESVFVPDTDAATEWLRSYLRPDDVVLLKASNAVRLGRVADALLADDAGGPREGRDPRR
jgi:UDP-N-acetylmuramoyl-tripeptide--D-alanyl-D-alanine ligase